MKGRNIVTRSIRRSRQTSRLPIRAQRDTVDESMAPGSPEPRREGTAVQLFLFRDERFLGSQLFDVAHPVVVGRSKRAALRLEGDNLSRLHCRFIYEAGEIMVEDLGSANGTFVNRARVAGRLVVEPTDAIHLGAYSIRARALRPEGLDRIPEKTETEAVTRVEAVLSAGSDSESEEAVVDVSRGVDRRLYEDAIARVTGNERARAPRFPSSSNPFTPSSDDIPEAFQPQKPISDDIPVRMSFKSKSEAVRIDPDVEARLRDLDELIAALDAQKRAPGHPSLGSGSKKSGVSLYAIDGMLGKSISPEGKAASADLERQMIEGLRSMSTQEFARDLKSKLGVATRLEKAEKKAKALAPVPPPLPKTPSMMAPPPLPRLSTVPRAPMAEAGERISDTADTAKGSASTQEESGPYEDVWTNASRVAPLSAAQRAEAERVPATMKDPPPLPPPAPVLPPPPLPRAPQKPLATDRTSQPTERNAPVYFEAVEIAARARGKLVDVAILRNEGDQYVLGHVTPQGRVAPGSCHGGLRMLRINPDRTVDLVFPRDVGGHLVRGRETVMFSELTEGRKYSCLRLEVHDIATMILGDGGRAITYHIRFITKISRPWRPAVRPT